ncbi:MAG: ABC transporter permease [Micavibrio sp.]|nr:MAG: ABC transporter permease [Micavibrio sp.]
MAVIFMVIAAAMTAAIAGLMKPILDDVLYAQTADMIQFVALAIFVTFVVRGISTYIHTILMGKISQSIIADIQRDLFGHFMILDLTFFHGNPSGQLISRVINDVNVMRAAVTDTLTGLGKSLLTLIFLIGLMIYTDWKLTLLSFAIFPFVGGMIAYIGRQLRKISNRTQDELAGLSDILSQIFQGIRQVQAYGMEDYESKRAGNVINNVRDLNIKTVRVRNLSTPVNEIIVGIAFGAVIAYGGHQINSGVLSAGELGSFIAAFALAYEPMKKLAKLNNSLQVGLGATERVFEMLDRPSGVKQKENAKGLDVRKPEIAFNDVEFQYEETDVKALNKISFQAKPGKVTALVGPSGGGKSTIINLIPRFYDVISGAITIDGQNVQDLTLESLRQHIALVSQDITIFDNTVAANIAYGRDGASQEEIEKAAKAAAAHEFIQDFSEGYETLVGENGVKLSGGQRQRIAIARAILRDAPILLLDEATSALDNESEKAVQQALEELEKGRTTLVIAHRLSTVQSADQIIVLDQGEIVETGTHESLLVAGGLFAKMHSAGLRE